MRFTCDGCGKRYATADEPVPGRVYKLTCKRCGHVIVLRVPAAVVGPVVPAPVEAPTMADANAVPASPARPAPTVPEAAAVPAVVPPAGPTIQATPTALPEGDLEATPADVTSTPPADRSPDLDLPPLLPDEGEEVAPAGAAAPAPEPAPESVDPPLEAGSRRRFELSRMSRSRTSLPLPVVLVALLIVVAVVVALIRADRPRPSHAPPAPSTAAAPAR